MQSAFKFSLFAHPCPFFCYSIRLVRAENAENSVTKYTSVIHDHDCHSTVIEKVNLHDIITVQGFGVGGQGRGFVWGGETTQEWVTFFTVQIFFPGSDNIKGQAGIGHELNYIKSRKDLLKLEHFENT